jgi:hypothetical protein
MLLSRHVRQDIRDHELLVALLERELRDDSDCLDVGAHSGSMLREIVRLAPRGRHVAWEPLPAFAAALRQEFPGVEVREAALADESGQRELTHVIDEPAWSGLAARPTPGWAGRRRSRSEISGLDGAGPYDRARFAAIFASGERVNFVARAV